MLHFARCIETCQVTWATCSERLVHTGMNVCGGGGGETKGMGRDTLDVLTAVCREQQPLLVWCVAWEIHEFSTPVCDLGLYSFSDEFRVDP
jgi:hypothetical protein